MYTLVNFPLLVLVVSVVALTFATKLGAVFREKIRPMEEGEREDLDVVVTVTLTLLALIIGFTFSMTISRGDLRKSHEAAEASAIYTEYIRSDLLPESHAARLRILLGGYAWSLMVIMALFCNFLIAYGAHKRGKIIFVVLPIVVAVSSSLIADIDSSRGVIIRLHPQNLVSLSQGPHAQ